MPSKQSAAVRRRWEAARLAVVQPGFEAPDDESWGDLTAEPRGVDYLETEAGGLPAMWAVPKGASTDRVLMCIHGGGFVSGSIYTHRKMFGHLAKATGARALLVSYRLLPEGVFPGPVDDVTNAYRWLLDQGISAGRIAFAGDSVGGWLAITVQLRAREQGLPLPGDWRMAPTLANGQPAAIARYRDSAYGLGILTVTPAGIARITVFGGGPDLAAKFGFPPLFEGSLRDDGSYRGGHA